MKSSWKIWFLRAREILYSSRAAFGATTILPFIFIRENCQFTISLASTRIAFRNVVSPFKGTREVVFPRLSSRTSRRYLARSLARSFVYQLATPLKKIINVVYVFFYVYYIDGLRNGDSRNETQQNNSFRERDDTWVFDRLPRREISVFFYYAFTYIFSRSVEQRFLRLFFFFCLFFFHAIPRNAQDLRS